MKKFFKMLLVLLICLTMTGCFSEKKNLNEKEVAAAIREKYTIKNKILPTTNSLLSVNMALMKVKIH